MTEIVPLGEISDLNLSCNVPPKTKSLGKELGEAKLHLSKHLPCESTNLGEAVRQEEQVLEPPKLVKRNSNVPEERTGEVECEGDLEEPHRPENSESPVVERIVEP